MPWARVDDAFDDHPKVLALLEHDQGGAAIGLWILCLTWAYRNTLRKGKMPGLISASLPRRYMGADGRELAALLVKTGLWEALPEGDGWLIHDFELYLPTAKTSEARSLAGRKGAASRWGKRDDTEPKTDGNLPSQDGKLPSTSHDHDGKAMASDGSRAPARRAISYEIAPVPVPVPVPPSAGADKPRRPAGPGEPHIGTVVAAYADGATNAGLRSPASKLRARVGKDARQLAQEGWPIAFLVECAERLGASGYDDLAVQARRDDANANGRGPGKSGRQQETDDLFEGAARRIQARKELRQ
jgi:hypothetical protein